MKDWQKKQMEFEQVKARAKALQLRLTCTICGTKPRTLLNCPCGTTQYCSTECQRIDWRDRGHRKACKKIRNERAEEEKRAEEAKQAEAPTPPPEVFYGPAPRSHADEVRARIAAEHEAARVRREANPLPEPASARYGSRCPICLEEWDINDSKVLLSCCCRIICGSCHDKTRGKQCTLCRTPAPKTHAEQLARLRRHVENEVPEAMKHLGDIYREGSSSYGVVKSAKKAAKLYKRAVELGDMEATIPLSNAYATGDGVKLDRKKALQLIRISSERGDAHAQRNLGVYHRQAKEFEEAFRLFKMAADKGFTDAEINLGHCYMAGEGVEVNITEAKRYWERAAAKGNEHAIFALSRWFPDGQRRP